MMYFKNGVMKINIEKLNLSLIIRPSIFGRFKGLFSLEE